MISLVLILVAALLFFNGHFGWAVIVCVLAIFWEAS